MAVEEVSVEAPNAFSAYFRRVGYLRFGSWADRLIKKYSFNKLKKEMRQAGWETSLRGYIGTTLFGSILLGLLVFLILFGLAGFYFLSENMILGVLTLIASFGGGPIIGIIGFYIAIFYPKFKISDRKTQLDNSLSTVSSYMSAMTSAGVPPAPIFASLAREEITPVVTKEAERINRDIEILGLDVLRALEMAAYRSPSEKWASFLEGMIGTVNAGGDLTQYLSTETKAFMKFKQEQTKEYIENLGVLAEVFMILGVVSPLLFVVMIAVMSILSGSGGTSVMLLFIITYLVVPLLMIVQLVLVSVD